MIDGNAALDLYASDALYSEAVLNWLPPRDLTIAQWAEEYRILSPENCALPGPYRLAVTPFLKEILDCISDPTIEKIVMMKSAQVAWTDGVINNTVGYYIDQDPAPMLILFPTESMAERYSKEKLTPMIRDCSRLISKVSQVKSRVSRNTILSKNFRGGHLELVGSNSPVNLASSPIRIVVIEEPDRCAANSGGEGNSLKLAFERSKTFHNRKLILGGSPTIKGMSEIEREMLLTDQRYFKIPCPRCGVYERLTWSMVIWDKQEGRKHAVFGDHKPESARFRCDHCGEEFSNSEKNRMLSKGIWEETAEFTGAVGFYISELYSPFPKATIVDVVKKFLEAKKLKEGDPTLMITFVNTSLGETWEEKGEGVNNLAIIERLETYKKSEINPGVFCITASVDVQDDRLEYEVCGWGIGEESWSLDYRAFPGDPERPEVWQQLDAFLQGAKYKRNGIELKIACVCVDSSAHTKAVYDFIRSRQLRRWYAVKGSSKEAEPIVGRPSAKSLQKGIKLFPVGTDTAKITIMGRLKIEEPGPGYMHFPDHYPEEYFAQLTAEELVTRFEKGKAKRIWKKLRQRNEALDLKVYNLAALAILNPDWKALKRKIVAAEAKAEAEAPKEDKRAEYIKNRRKPGRKGNFVNNW